MKKEIKKHLLNHRYLVADKDPKDQFPTLFALAHFYGIKIIKGADLLNPDMFEDVAEVFTPLDYIPTPFYRGFPDSVRNLTREERLYDQLYSYFRTYGLGNFDEPTHSVMEKEFTRIAFQEDTTPLELQVITEDRAKDILKEMIEGLFSSTRPLNIDQLHLIDLYMQEYKYFPEKVASKNTAFAFLRPKRDLRFAKFITLPDVIKVVEEIVHYEYPPVRMKRLNNLNLKNKDRKFITALIRQLMDKKYFPECDEKRKQWKGLLHHIHFKPKTADEKTFLYIIRYSKMNYSAYSYFEKLMSEGRVGKAAEALEERKGSAAVLRNLDYLISRANRPSDISNILSAAFTRSNNGLVLIQLMTHYAFYDPKVAKQTRTFKFTKFNQLKTHIETPEERMRRRTILSNDDTNLLQTKIAETVIRHYEMSIKKKVYISECMKKVALPLQETTGQSGFGIMTRGTRLSIPEGKIIRAFTYWEKVDDIDMAIIGVDDNMKQHEISWRTFNRRGNEAESKWITWSGDETSGYHGGAEYFDIDLDLASVIHPNFKYLVLTNVIYSGCRSFDDCTCVAGYMMREKLSSGEIFEPKTVKSTFVINGTSRFAYLYAIDLCTKEIVWLNVSDARRTSIAGANDCSFLNDYIYQTNVINAYDFFNICASHRVYNQEEAEMIVSDDILPDIDEEKVEIIRPYDFEKMLKYLNK